MANLEPSAIVLCKQMRAKATNNMSQTQPRDDHDLSLIRNSLRVCLSYKPKFGLGKGDGITLDHFQELYRADEFYSWFGLDSQLVYAAHKAAGGMTSVYRQIGHGCQLVFHAVLQDSLGLSPTDATWSYNVKVKGAKARGLALDGRIPLDKIVTPLAQSAPSPGLLRQRQASACMAKAPKG